MAFVKQAIAFSACYLGMPSDLSLFPRRLALQCIEVLRSFYPFLQPPLTLSDRPARTLRTLPRVEVLALLAVDDLRCLLHDLGALSEDELDVARVRPAVY